MVDNENNNDDTSFKGVKDIQAKRLFKHKKLEGDRDRVQNYVRPTFMPFEPWYIHIPIDAKYTQNLACVFDRSNYNIINITEYQIPLWLAFVGYKEAFHSVETWAVQES